jgi:cephalosporin hydroxylase
MITIDPDNDRVTVDSGAGGVQTYSLSSPEAFAAVSKVWLRAGWDTKYVYSFTWHGRPIIQLPDDLVRIQEVVFSVAPDLIIETGVAHGGSLVFYAGLCKILGRGRVVGVDVEIRPHNRAAIEAHPLASYITLIEGSSIDTGVVEEVRSHVRENDTVLVTLDSNHTKDHVLAELRAYGPLVTSGSYIVAMDGIMGDLVGAPRTGPDWGWNNPTEAARAFVAENTDFVLEEPPKAFNEGVVDARVTYWPDGFLRRR